MHFFKSLFQYYQQEIFNVIIKCSQVLLDFKFELLKKICITCNEKQLDLKVTGDSYLISGKRFRIMIPYIQNYYSNIKIVISWGWLEVPGTPASNKSRS